MQYRILGKTGLKVSAVGFGGIPIQRIDERGTRALMERLVEKGVNYIDTARGYTVSESYLGEALSGGLREKFILATKSMSRGYADMARDIGISLSNLRTDYIDLYYLHRINETVRLEDVAIVMGRLVKEGLIRGWGLSQVSADQIRAAHEITPLSAVQNIYSMVERDCETEIFPVCLEKGIGVVPFSPIASGFLSGKVTAQEQFGFDDVRKFVPQLSKENIEANRPILDLLHRFAVEKNATNAQISLAWMLHKYPNVVPIPGSKNQERILENLGAWNVTLSGDEFRQLQSALDECKVHGHRGCVETEQTSFGKQWSEETAK